MNPNDHLSEGRQNPLFSSRDSGEVAGNQEPDEMRKCHVGNEALPEARLLEGTWGNTNLRINVDEEWAFLMRQPFEVQIERISNQFHWIHILPGTGLSWEQQEKFWHQFCSADAAEKRRVAILGTKAANHDSELDLLNFAFAEFQKLRAHNSGEELGEMDKPQMELLGIRFGRLVFDCIENGDSKPFSRMATILGTPEIEEGGPREQGSQTVGDSEAGKIYRAFCRLHLSTRSLPTKKLVRIEAGYSDTAEDLSKISKLLKSLGLSGLPEAGSLT